jgi:CHAT domain-containing protein
LSELGRNESLLTYYFANDWVYAVHADRRGVRQVRAGKSAGIRGQIKSILDGLQDPGAPAPDAALSRLGQTLMGGLSRSLGERLYLLPSGPLSGFPFDALRLDDAYLAERRSVLNLDSVSTLLDRPGDIGRDYDQRVFVAGNPRAGRDLFSYGVSSSEEIAAVRDRFVGGGLHIVQGVALRGDEFQDERYSNAGLIHLAMPGRVDLARPANSRLLLSGERESPTAEFLSPADLRGMPVSAQLAVLSGTSFTNRGGTDFDSRLGLVNDLQAAGARKVVASLWPAGDAETAQLMSVFYSRLSEDRDIGEALIQARRTLINTQDGANIRSWAGFQLFLR